MDIHAVFVVFISLKADWLNEEKVASKFVASVFGNIDSSASTLSSINQALLKINEIADIPTPIRELSNYTRRHYQKKKIIRDAADSLLKENYRMHGSLAGNTADEILEAVGASDDKENDTNDSDDSCTSHKYHPKRSRKYSVSVPKDDYEGSVIIFYYIFKVLEVDGNLFCYYLKSVSEDSEMMNELKEFRYRSIELTKTNANQVSDLRLL
ncbi:hypothetical protein BD770DRAFT_396368 [Pilaira anomala]|nr:hypothetical protein BD770DRAFT_396368 [Pilaira anomala]